MKQAAGTAEASLELKALVFQMHTSGYTHDAIAAYLGKSKTVINELLKPLQNKKGKGAE